MPPQATPSGWKSRPRQSRHRRPRQAKQAAGRGLTLRGVVLLDLRAHGWTVTRCHRQILEAEDGREDGSEAEAGRNFGGEGLFQRLVGSILALTHRTTRLTV